MHEIEEQKITLNPRHYVSKRLKRRIAMYFLISLFILGIVIYHIIVDKVNFIYPITAIFVGMLIGIIASRMFKISWDHGAQEVIYTFDVVGILFLIAYIIFALYRDRIIEHFVKGPSVVAVSFAVVAGLMYGRVLGISRQIVQVVEEQHNKLS